MWLAFTNSAIKELFVNWEEFAHCLLVHFRADYAQNASEQSWTELAVALQKVSPQFRKWWKSHDVARPHEVQELNHPIVGKLVLDSVTFQVYPAANLRLTAYTPKANTDKVKLQKLLLITPVALEDYQVKNRRDAESAEERSKERGVIK